MDPSVPGTTPTAEKPALSDPERAERLKLLAERLRKPDGLDHEALAQVERLSGRHPAWWRAAPHDLGSVLEQAVLDDSFWITPVVRHSPGPGC